MKQASTTFFLIAAGALLLVIGCSILIAPQAFYPGGGLVLEDDPSVISEMRAPGGLLAGSAILILAGAARRRLRSFAVPLTALVYGCYGLSRLLSIALDGVPSPGLVGAAAIELLAGAIGLFMLLRQPSSRSLEPLPEMRAASSAP